MEKRLTITLSVPAGFVQVCERDLVAPDKVLRQFIADLCHLSEWTNDPRIDGYFCNSAADRTRAWDYYDAVHGRNGRWIRENLPHLVRQPADG